MANAQDSLSPFLFLAATPMGSRKIGLRSALSEPALSELLRRDHLLLLRAWKLPSWAASAEAEVAVSDELAMNDQLASLLGRGVPLTEALDVVASLVRPQTKEKVERIRELVAGGSSFAGACEQVGGFDEITIAVYRAAERAGDLDGAAARLASAARRRMAISRKAGTLLIYPAIVLAISVIVVFGMLTLVVPRIGSALVDAGVALPWFSKLVFQAGFWASDHALWLALGGVMLLVIAAVLRRQIVRGAMALLTRLPAVARLQLAVEATRFFSVMAAMSRSGVPVAEALATSSQSVSHPKLREQLVTLQRRLVEGGLLRTLLEDVTALPLATRRLLIAADRAGDLDTAFDGLAKDMAEEVDTRSDRLLALLEPLLIVGLFAIIGTLLLAIMIPMITLSGSAGSSL